MAKQSNQESETSDILTTNPPVTDTLSDAEAAAIRAAEQAKTDRERHAIVVANVAALQAYMARVHSDSTDTQRVRSTAGRAVRIGVNVTVKGDRCKLLRTVAQTVREQVMARHRAEIAMIDAIDAIAHSAPGNRLRGEDGSSELAYDLAYLALGLRESKNDAMQRSSTTRYS